jgi:hypothetical protein
VRLHWKGKLINSLLHPPSNGTVIDARRKSSLGLHFVFHAVVANVHATDWNAEIDHRHQKQDLKETSGAGGTSLIVKPTTEPHH